MSANEKDLQKKIDDELKKYDALKSAFLKIYDSEADVKKKRSECYEEINKIEERDNSILSDIYKEFNSRMKDLEEIRKRHLEKIYNKILPTTAFYPEKIKTFKKRMNDLSSLRKAKAKNEQEKAKQQKVNNVDQVQNQTNLIMQQTVQEKKDGESLEKDICQFESERINDNKCLFLHFIHSELEYHAAALESMSALFHNINQLEPLLVIDQFINSYNIKINENELKDIVKDLDNIKLKNQRVIDEKANRTNKVFGDTSNISNNSKSKVNQSEIGMEYMGSKNIQQKINHI